MSHSQELMGAKEGSDDVHDDVANISSNSDSTNANNVNTSDTKKNTSHKNVLLCIHRYWKSMTSVIHRCLLQGVLVIAVTSARYPKRTIGLVTVLSVSLLVVGLMTNFVLALDDERIFAPDDCRPREHFSYVESVDGFPAPTRPIVMIIHANGDNVVTYQAMDQMLQATNLVRSLEGYRSICATTATTTTTSSSSSSNTTTTDCTILGPTRFWDHNRTLFELQTQRNDDVVAETLSQDVFDTETKTPVAHAFFLGYYERETVYNVLQFDDDDNNDEDGGNSNNTNSNTSITDTDTTNSVTVTTTEGTISYAKALQTNIFFPNLETPTKEGWTTLDFETKAIEALLELRNQFNNNINNQTSMYQLEFYTPRSVPDEMTRAVANDLPLLPVVFGIMSLFTCLVFARPYDRVQSRMLLGIGSVVTIFFSIMSGFGIAFLLGLPFTNLTQILPFVIFGVGLDDTFIITGAYFRSTAMDPNRNKSNNNDNNDIDTAIILRIQNTMMEIGASIILTTITTTLAFFMGWLTSSIPNIQWLCLYALFAISIDFIYQITFFIAILVLDERRIQAQRYDCCICFVKQQPEDDHDDENNKDDNNTGDNEDENNNNGTELATTYNNNGCSNHAITLPERFMEWYGHQLLRPRVKLFVLLGFTTFLGYCAYSATLLTQEFVPADFLPQDSYAQSFLEASASYTTSRLRVATFFRDIDQSDPNVREQMIQFIHDLSNMPQINKAPDFCWVTDLDELLSGNETDPEHQDLVDLLQLQGNLTFSQQLDLLLAIPAIQDVYGDDIARFEDTGEIEASRCVFSINGVDVNKVEEQIKFLADQRRLTASQPLNAGRQDRFAGFSFDPIFFLWEFYTAVIDELIFTTVSGITAVTVVAFILIPHWTACFFVLPMMVILYIDLLGTLQFAGMHINPLVYICLIMSIGLLVDFIMHVLLRYYESPFSTREEKVKDTLKTLGASIFVGGLSTCLGVVPLAFSSSGIIQTVFVLFISMITLGVGHGLIFLPVVLSYVGPTIHVELQGAHQPQGFTAATKEDGATRDSLSSDVSKTEPLGQVDAADNKA